MIKTTTCKDCEKKISYKSIRCKSCSNKNRKGKYHISKEAKRYGKLSPNWGGGEYKTKEGYILSFAPKHHRSNIRGYVFKHILIMEEKLGRKIKKGEVVHHIDSNCSNNRPDNLHLFENSAKHKRHHNFLRGLIDNILGGGYYYSNKNN